MSHPLPNKRRKLEKRNSWLIYFNKSAYKQFETRRKQDFCYYGIGDWDSDKYANVKKGDLFYAYVQGEGCLTLFKVLTPFQKNINKFDYFTGENAKYNANLSKCKFSRKMINTSIKKLTNGMTWHDYVNRNAPVSERMLLPIKK